MTIILWGGVARQAGRKIEVKNAWSSLGGLGKNIASFLQCLFHDKPIEADSLDCSRSFQVLLFFAAHCNQKSFVLPAFGSAGAGAAFHHKLAFFLLHCVPLGRNYMTIMLPKNKGRPKYLADTKVRPVRPEKSTSAITKRSHAAPRDRPLGLCVFFREARVFRKI